MLGPLFHTSNVAPSLQRRNLSERTCGVCPSQPFEALADAAMDEDQLARAWLRAGWLLELHPRAGVLG